MAKKSKPVTTDKATKEREKSKSGTVPSRSKKAETPKVFDLTLDDDEEAPVKNNNEIDQKIKVN